MADSEYKLTQKERAFLHVFDQSLDKKFDAWDQKLKQINKDTYEQGTGFSWDNRHKVKDALDHGYRASQARTRNIAALWAAFIIVLVSEWWDHIVPMFRGN